MQVKPATKQLVASVTRRVSPPMSAYATPDTYERYAGSSGHTQGEMNEMKPAANAAEKPHGPEGDRREHLARGLVDRGELERERPGRRLAHDLVDDLALRVQDDRRREADHAEALDELDV